MFKTLLHSLAAGWLRRAPKTCVLTGLVGCAAAWFPAWQLQGAEHTEAKSALETDPEGWVDILPPPDLKGWYRVPVPPTGKLGREQWHVDAEKKV